MNQELEAMILLVINEDFIASFTQRILFIKIGRIFNELGTRTRYS